MTRRRKTIHNAYYALVAGGQVSVAASCCRRSPCPCYGTDESVPRITLRYVTPRHRRRLVLRRLSSFLRFAATGRTFAVRRLAGLLPEKRSMSVGRLTDLRFVWLRQQFLPHSMGTHGTQSRFGSFHSASIVRSITCTVAGLHNLPRRQSAAGHTKSLCSGLPFRAASFQPLRQSAAPQAHAGSWLTAFSSGIYAVAHSLRETWAAPLIRDGFHGGARWLFFLSATRPDLAFPFSQLPAPPLSVHIFSPFAAPPATGFSPDG